MITEKKKIPGSKVTDANFLLGVIILYFKHFQKQETHVMRFRYFLKNVLV